MATDSEFLSPLSNQRRDAYGGSLRIAFESARDCCRCSEIHGRRGAPLLVRISATDWIDGGWDIQQSVELARQLKNLEQT